MIEQVTKLFPQLQDKIDYIEIGKQKIAPGQDRLHWNR